MNLPDWLLLFVCVCMDLFALPFACLCVCLAACVLAFDCVGS